LLKIFVRRAVYNSKYLFDIENLGKLNTKAMEMDTLEYQQQFSNRIIPRHFLTYLKHEEKLNLFHIQERNQRENES